MANSKGTEAVWSVYASIVQTRMDDLGINNKELAERMAEIGYQVSPSTIGSILRCDSQPLAENFLAINYALFRDAAPKMVIVPMTLMMFGRRQ